MIQERSPYASNVSWESALEVAFVRVVEKVIHLSSLRDPAMQPNVLWFQRCILRRGILKLEAWPVYRTWDFR